MPENDLLLINAANKLSCTEWGKASTMAFLAQSPEAKDELEMIEKRLYHMEEAAAGLI